MSGRVGRTRVPRHAQPLRLGISGRLTIIMEPLDHTKPKHLCYFVVKVFAWERFLVGKGANVLLQQIYDICFSVFGINRDTQMENPVPTVTWETLEAFFPVDHNRGWQLFCRLHGTLTIKSRHRDRLKSTTLRYRNIPNKDAGAMARSCLIVLDQCWRS